MDRFGSIAASVNLLFAVTVCCHSRPAQTVQLVTADVTSARTQVIVVTQRNIPAAGAAGLDTWVRRGGDAGPSERRAAPGSPTSTPV
jgi:hypothetical protein